ncbi:TetR/AcrR family transcriptional regulator [Clostridium intestinale]|uniref:TetR/AcrR family transcriptional regulator n=2 Tax=Clostridium intestinale TaxID=36845 RepID=A0A7D7A0X1_9CLOT|nr:TetR/AcrR family transcriptional regulator [Clostridium intestinale]
MNMDDKEIIERYINDETLPEDELTKRHWEILEAATKIFSEKGFENSRTSDIAKEANIAEGTIFRYYKTKKDLLMGLFIPMIIKFFRPMMLSSVEKIFNNEDMSIEEVIKAIFMDRLQLIRKNMPLVKTLVIEAAYKPEILAALRETLLPKIVAVIDGFMIKNIEKGIFKDMDPRIMTRSFMSILAGYIVLTVNFPNMFPVENDEEEVEKMTSILLDGIRKLL